MLMSIGTDGDKVNFRQTEVSSMEHLAEIILASPYSLGIFQNDYRTKANFIQAEAIGLDFDDGVTLAEAEEMFKDYSHIIAPSRNHQVEKNGVVQDRFRVILLLKYPITDAETFESTWYSLFNKYPKLDKACKDASRFFYPSQFIHAIKTGGLRVEPVILNITPEIDSLDEVLDSDLKGELGKRALKFLTFGAPKGQKHNELYASARDAHQNGYTEEWFLDQLKALYNKTQDEDYIDEGTRKAVADAFKKDPKHEPRLEKKSFNLVKIGELYKDDSRMDWLVECLLSRGGLSVLVADPKTGKSTLARQLIRDVLRGSPFLSLRCKPGSVFYFAIEEQVQVLNWSFKRLGITDEDKLAVHVGDVLADNVFEDFAQLVTTEKPDLVVVDTLFDIVNVESEYSYKEVKRELRRIRQVARESNAHILLVHHSSKGQAGEKRRGNRAILGSQAIAGGVDTIVVIEKEGRERLITTSGREVYPWEHRRLVWDKDTATYSLGPETTDEDLY